MRMAYDPANYIGELLTFMTPQKRLITSVTWNVCTLYLSRQQANNMEADSGHNMMLAACANVIVASPPVAQASGVQGLPMLTSGWLLQDACHHSSHKAPRQSW